MTTYQIELCYHAFTNLYEVTGTFMIEDEIVTIPETDEDGNLTGRDRSMDIGEYLNRKDLSLLITALGQLRDMGLPVLGSVHGDRHFDI